MSGIEEGIWFTGALGMESYYGDKNALGHRSQTISIKATNYALQVAHAGISHFFGCEMLPGPLRIGNDLEEEEKKKTRFYYYTEQKSLNFLSAIFVKNQSK